MATVADMNRQLFKLKTLTQQFLSPPKIAHPKPLDESFQKLRQMTADISKDMEGRISPRLLEIFALVLDNIESVGLIVDSNCIVMHANKVAKARALNLAIGKKCYVAFEYSSDNNAVCRKQCKVKEALKSRQAVNYEYASPLTQLEYDVVAIPLIINSTTLIMIIASRKEV